ncbi:MAG: hypothetical protein FJY56_10835 [Betaproteobacteria bacterium]|nr:hypothetical protein [Betaproteobacteria bacterium]
MDRRTFVQRCAAFGAGTVIDSRAVIAQTPPVRAGAAGTKPGHTEGGLTYVGSYPTPTLTDNFVKPPKTARLNFGKHTKMAYCPANEMIYTCGGDGQGQHWGGDDSGTMDTVGRYDVKTQTYREDFPYQGYPGEPTPRGLDFIAFTWSPSLQEFWLGPGYSWNYVKQYPWLDTRWSTAHYATYNPSTRRFTDRGPRRGGAFGEGFAGSWDTTRDRLIWFDAGLKALQPASNQVLAVGVTGAPISSHRTETADTWYDPDTDELYFVQLATGRVYVCHVGGQRLRLVADTAVKTGDASSHAVIYLTDSKHCLIVYDSPAAGALPWKLVNLVTGAVRHLNLYAPGCDHYNTGVYHPPSKTIVLTGGSGPANRVNGAAFHHYRSVL